MTTTLNWLCFGLIAATIVAVAFYFSTMSLRIAVFRQILERQERESARGRNAEIETAMNGCIRNRTQALFIGLGCIALELLVLFIAP